MTTHRSMPIHQKIGHDRIVKVYAPGPGNASPASALPMARAQFPQFQLLKYGLNFAINRADIAAWDIGQ